MISVQKLFRNSAFLLGLALLLPGIAGAEVQSVAVNPSVANINITGGTVNLAWQVNRRALGSGVLTTTSPAAQIVVGGSAIATVAGNLQRSAFLRATQTDMVTFNETITISPTLAQQILNGGGGTIRRNFSDSDSATTLSANVTVQLSRSTQLILNRLELAFHDNAKTKVLPSNGDLRAIADIRFTGSGSFTGEWRITHLDASASGQFERLLRVVRAPLISAGGGTVRLRSPKLPTNLTGLYSVRLVPTRPQAGFAIPAIRYYVTPKRLDAPELLRVELVQPANNTSVTSETLFSWARVPGAMTYELLIYRHNNWQRRAANGSTLTAQERRDLLDDELELAAGTVVPGGAIAAKLKQYTLAHLRPGERYRWRVKAYDKAGKLIAQSELRPIQRP